ncbi:uncharacterized protein LOC113324365 [Papaver somniferum]|uniref:uncharacterized protein LOC113324365 n=1 Tax=Papaver somniferum TaxID=3469 RepID=UPI000E705B9A|nr:uncharacterized protein LOC113324365 [Papaver somniferum]
MIEAIPDADEIKKTLFDMDQDSAPGPDGFSGSFYRACWNVIHHDVVDAIQFCWSRRFIPKGMSSNFLVLIPKIEGARNPKQFRPIGLSNVSFKIFTKFLATRMGKLMHKLVSPQQVSYVKGRCIHDQILLASELVNEMNKKRRCRNVALKLDISQAYDSVSWEFLFQSKSIYYMANGINDAKKVGNLESIPVYNMAVYKWPASVIKTCERIMRNFLWSGDGETRQYNTFSWKRVCTPLSEGGLGISRLVVINKAFLMKMMWKINNSKEDWALFFQAKYKDKNGQWETKWQKSIVWSGLKWAWDALKEDTRWIIGNGERISVSFDSWIGDNTLFGNFEHNSFLAENIKLKVSDLLSNGVWSFNNEFQLIFQNLLLPEVLGGEDVLLWTRNLKGDLSIPEAVNKLRHKEQFVNWSRYLWKPFLHPSIASNVWKLIEGIYNDDKKMIHNGCEMVSRCCICEAEQDSINHFLWECNFSIEVWKWICSIFQFKLPNYFDYIWKLSSKKSPLVKQVWISAACIILKELWFQKNKKFFENIKPNMQRFKCRIMQLIMVTSSSGDYDYDSSSSSCEEDSKISAAKARAKTDHAKKIVNNMPLNDLKVSRDELLKRKSREEIIVDYREKRRRIQRKILEAEEKLGSRPDGVTSDSDAEEEEPV